MSSLIGNAMPGNPLDANDARVQPRGFTMDRELTENFLSPWWPGSGFVGAGGTDVGMLDDAQHWYEQPEITRGTNTRYGFVGVTRDVYGSPLTGCTVKAFRTADDVLTDTVVSDGLSGAFLVSTPFHPDAHYLMSRKAGSPNVQGVSANTLIGA